MIDFFQTLIEHAPDWGRRLLPATGQTVLITAASFGLALALAVLIEFGRTSGVKVIRRAIGCYIEVVRALPILAVLYLIYFGLPGLGVTFSPFTAGTIGLGVVYSTYLAEVLRAGVESLHRGQREAALAGGMTPLLVFRLIILPQAVRVVLPPLLVSVISLLKDSSVCALIAVNELTLSGRVIMSESFLPLHVFVLVGAIYFSIAWPMSLFVRWLEPRLNRGRRSIAPAEL
jgi:His/Glu/Gln/Arg/opine family amino acid ABC transporter permease subunit